jgi:(S)-citramalyl-CoA lyase
LFVPVWRPDRFHKALDAGADIVCIDMEDAVARERKAEGRALTLPMSNK